MADWRSQMRTAPYLFHLEVRTFFDHGRVPVDLLTILCTLLFLPSHLQQVPHTMAGEAFAGRKDEMEFVAPKSDTKQHLEDAAVVDKYRRESCGHVGPALFQKVKTDRQSLPGVKTEEVLPSNSSSDDSSSIKKQVTYADLVQNALTDMYQKNKISVPIWCRDTSAIKSVQHLLGTTSSLDVQFSQGDGTPSSQYSMVTFTSEYPELVKQRLAVNIGLGTKVGSMNMIPVTISKRADHHQDESTTSNESGADGVHRHSSGDAPKPHPKEKERNAFFASIQSRLVVEQVVQTVRSAATFSFDYLMLVLVAACLAAVGLATNNTVIIVASMLVSPIMGPILGKLSGISPSTAGRRCIDTFYSFSSVV